MFHPRDAELEVPLTLKVMMNPAVQNTSDMANRDDHIGLSGRQRKGDKENTEGAGLLQV